MKVLVIEGMGSFPCVRNGLIAPLQAQYKLDVEYLPWASAWKYSVKPGYSLVIGHSLGGHTALKIAAHDPRPVFLTLDPRRQDALSWTDWLIPWRGAFPRVKGARIVNFYQKLPLAGYAVEGAENRRVFSTHGGLPGNRHVREWVRGFIEERL